jgi:hypothetical protein
MNGVRVPSFRISKTYRVTDLPPQDFIADLLGKGFVIEAVGGTRANGTNGKKIKRKRRRKARVALTAERIREFRKARQEGKSYRRIGNIFGVSEGRAWQIVNQGK